MFVMGGNSQRRARDDELAGAGAGQLYQDQDLQVTIDYRDILAEIVSRRLGNSNLDHVFPGYVPSFRGAVR